LLGDDPDEAMAEDELATSVPAELME